MAAHQAGCWCAGSKNNWRGRTVAGQVGNLTAPELAAAFAGALSAYPGGFARAVLRDYGLADGDSDGSADGGADGDADRGDIADGAENPQVIRR